MEQMVVELATAISSKRANKFVNDLVILLRDSEPFRTFLAEFVETKMEARAPNMAKLEQIYSHPEQ